jgi:hypothetical protein
MLAEKTAVKDIIEACGVPQSGAHQGREIRLALALILRVVCESSRNLWYYGSEFHDLYCAKDTARRRIFLCLD